MWLIYGYIDKINNKIKYIGQTSNLEYRRYKHEEYDPFHENASAPTASAVEQKSICELFSDFYTERSGGEGPDEDDMELLTFIEELALHADVHSNPGEAEIEKILTCVSRQEAKA